MQDAMGRICDVFSQLRSMLYVDDMQLHFRGVTCDLSQRTTDLFEELRSWSYQSRVVA